MDIKEMLRQIMIMSKPSSGVSVQTQAALNQPGLDQVDPATGQLTAGGEAPPVAPVPTAPAIPNGGSTRPLNAQEALQRGDPKLQYLLLKRQAGAPPTPPPISGFGVKPPRQTSFGQETATP